MESRHLLDIIRNPRADAAMRFIEATRGPRLPEFGIPVQELDHLEMPEPLRAFYEFAGRWPGLYRQNVLLAPDKLHVDGDRLIFYDENQHVFEWATTVTGQDPPVWFREPGMRAHYGRWHAERAPLTVFLLQTLLEEYAMGIGSACAAGGQAVAAELAASAISGLEPVPFGPLGGSYDPIRSWLLAGDDIVARVDLESIGGSYWVVMGATSAEALDYLRPTLGPDWF
jgi:hypothetical protein